MYFLDPVDVSKVPGYSDIIDRPMDLETLEKIHLMKRNNNSSSSVVLESFISDLDLIWSNCLTFNTPESDISKAAVIMREEANKLLVEAGFAIISSNSNYKEIGDNVSIFFLLFICF